MSLFEHELPPQQLRQRRAQLSEPPARGSLFAADADADDEDDCAADKSQTGSGKPAPKQRVPGPDGSACLLGCSRAAGQLWPTVLAPVALTLLSAATRFYRIGRANRVVWDEAHFGKFGAHYVNGTFYHDVHPPLAKMLVGLSEALTGFDGTFTFESGQRYPGSVNYTFMRAFNASFGVPLAPLAYFTLLNLGCRPSTALLGGLMVCLDNALCTISRFILLDAMLLCFTAASALSLSGLYKHRSQAFSRPWWKWLFATGASLGLVASAKWVGLLAVALVGLYTIHELYELLGQRDLRVSGYAKHWAARLVALVAVPLAIYALCFKVHFALLYRSGPGDAEMDSLFQAHLEGTNLLGQPLDVAYGSLVTLKSAGAGVGLLHSHKDAYPEGSRQQQITGYTHKDQNNYWLVEKVHGAPQANATGPAEFVRHHDVVRLVHAATSRNLHSHAVAGHVSKRDWEVSGYGKNSTYADPNDHWRVEVVEELSQSNPERRVRTLATQFRLRHIRQGCVLRASGKSLPQWAWKQAEIVCDRRNRLDKNTLWNVETHVNAQLPPADPKDLKSPFLRNFIRLNKAMARTNNALVPDKDKIDQLTSDPSDWPIMRLGLRICGWEDSEVKFWLIGNPAVWWTSTLAVVLGVLQLVYYAVRRQRGLCDFARPQLLENHLYVSWVLLGGWALHYLPFFLMGRVTYLHHYFPALYFAAMYLAYAVEWNCQRVVGAAGTRAALAALGLAVVVNFAYFAPFTFGFDYPAKELAGRQWLSTWNIFN
ncbi:Protein O-mannosyltransferase 2 [Coemansia nantahalensis]|uniref:Protein O-mannosyltransferase 2 n=2 Tax=Coemansia TaxID=4863 RepID=A0ACC1LHE9_9FUNG|nr:Protein O-mannosyltransferase 2 [Coemansia nantahalensis]KAJ2775572.1 Protein O-mannosyltransferase 2 [Coemansia nantahalensis]KAJ2808223.1 Protein O-mannosyltransferase 2 [Coemansia helicoidea]